MAVEQNSPVRLEIGHVVFIDIVGYSKLLITEQGERVRKLTDIVRDTGEFRRAEKEAKLVRIPTGDGMALVFRDTPEAPVQCALELSRKLKDHPELEIRMGIHSGPVNEVTDVNERTNITGAGINLAQRVMDCGDAGHILLSKHVADDLEQYPQWRSCLHDLGECEVKHGLRVSVVNLYTNDAGNPKRPEKFSQVSVPVAGPTQIQSTRPGKNRLTRLALGALVLVCALVLAAVVWFSRSRNKTASSTIPDKSIAVLPFDNLSDDKQNAYFTDGVQDEILTDLAKIADLKVISRSSVMQYKTGFARNLRKIGQELGVAHLLEGSVQRAANKVRVNAQLIDARNDAHLWAQTYDRDLADVFAIQSEISKAIADQLQAKILPHERKAIEKQPTQNIAAYDLYVRALSEIEAAPESSQPKQHLLTGIELLGQAVQRDPEFVEAHCLAARAHDQMYLFGEDHSSDRLALAEQAVNAALRLQPASAEAHLARALHLYSKLDYNAARAEIEIVRRTLPNDRRAFELSGYIDRRQGRWEESTRNLEHALELDPNNVFLLQQTATSYDSLRQYGKQAALLDRAISIRPDDLDTRISRAQLEVFSRADPRPMHDVIRSAIDRDPSYARRLAATRVFLAFAERDAAGGMQAIADLGENTFGPNALQFPSAAGAGVFATLKGDSATAMASFAQARATQEKVVEKQPEYGPSLCILAMIDADLGRKEDALREIKRALELLPLDKDAINGAHIIRIAGMIYSAVGEKQLALDQLKHAAEIPSGATFGELKLFPHWDALRGDPQFEQIVASLAPK